MEFGCTCGAHFSAPEAYAGRLARCNRCHARLQLTVGVLPLEQSSAGDFECRLIVESGPDLVGQQFLLGGTLPIEVGKLEDKPIYLPGARVSRHHCRLIRTSPYAWTMEDQGSTNGSIVNGQRASHHNLKDGDAVRIGEYQLRFLCSARVPAMASAGGQESAPPDADAEAEEIIDLETDSVIPRQEDLLPPDHHAETAGPLHAPTCPSCGRQLTRNARICIDCGINVHSGRSIIIAHGLDEEELRSRAEKFVGFVSWLIRVGPFYPIASEAYGAKRAYLIWSIAAITLITSSAFWVARFRSDNPFRCPGDQYMLWPIARPTPVDLKTFLANERREIEEEYGEIPRDEWLEARRFLALKHDAVQHPPYFRWYQLVTNAFLHGDLLHIAGNFVFLLVFGTRVNALIGNIATLILYPILAAGASLAHLYFDATPGIPALGASGAIMGLAGMYFILFPIHKVHMVSWVRLPIIAGFRFYLKVWSIRGFWVVLTFIGFDVVATLLGSEDGVAHWAHLGGFIVGMVIAIGLLLSRQFNSRGGDILSVLLGRYAWPILGKPSRWATSAA